MAQKLIFVFTDKSGTLGRADRDSTGYRLLEDGNKNLNVFLEEKHAEKFAQEQSLTNPGSDVYILKQTHGYYTPFANQPEKKVWKDGYYIPEEKAVKS